MKEEKVFYVSYEEWNEACREEAVEEAARLADSGYYDRETKTFGLGVGNSTLHSRGWYMSLDEDVIASRALNRRDMPHGIKPCHIKSVEIADGLEWVGRITVLIDLERAEKEKKSDTLWFENASLSWDTFPSYHGCKSVMVGVSCDTKT